MRELPNISRITFHTSASSTKTRLKSQRRNPGVPPSKMGWGHVRQIHVKDATATAEPGTWGTEVPVGDGEVVWPAFLDIVSTRLPGVDMMIEREAGEDRVGDMRRARDLIRELHP